MTLAEAKGGWLGSIYTFPSSMAQNFWIAIYAWSVCFVVTILVSLVTAPKKDEELRGLVYGLTEIPTDATSRGIDGHCRWPPWSQSH
jgi:SSS family solute:Na+ symporter